MRLGLILMAASVAGAQETIRFTPAVVTQCAANGLGSGLVSWDTDMQGPVTVRIGDRSGVALTGESPVRGSAQTGDWVSDGMVFVLVDAFQHELGRTSVRVQCKAAATVLPGALAVASYWPLQVGNEWVYVSNNRVSTSTYLTQRIIRADIIQGQVWFVVQHSATVSAPVLEMRFRIGDGGRIYQLPPLGQQLSPQPALLLLDPSIPPDPAAAMTVVGRGETITTPAGVFSDTISYRGVIGGLSMQTGTYARGIGLISSSNSMLSGSSGGFTDGLTLLSAKIDGHIVYAPAAYSLEVGAEARWFDVSNQRATNCAIPCYFVACGVAGADPPGTYKPCFRATIKAATMAADLDLLDASNNSVYHVTLTGNADVESLIAHQVQLYTKPNQPFPPGSYTLRVKTPDGRVAIVPVQLQ